MLKRTPLFAAHQKAGGRLIEFGGWEMPVQYSGIVDEHLCVRKAAGIFDISHMGEVRLEGPAAAAFLNRTLTNDIRKLAVGQGQYTLMCQENGGVVDDLYAYRTAEQQFLLIINASRIEADVAWLEQRLALDAGRDQARLENISDVTGALAVQGPAVARFIDGCFQGPASAGTPVTRPTDLKKNQLSQFVFGSAPVWVARTGYTGEDGFEIILPAAEAEAAWNSLLAAGQPFGLKPAGLGARDTLRTEMCYPLYGHELDLETTPIEAGLGFFVALDKGEFCGRAALAAQKSEGVKKKCAAFRMVDKSAPPRPQYPIWSRSEPSAAIGRVVSGTQSPSLGIGIGLGYVPPPLAQPGTLVEIEIRGKRYAADIVAKPILKKAAG